MPSAEGVIEAVAKNQTAVLKVGRAVRSSSEHALDLPVAVLMGNHDEGKHARELRKMISRCTDSQASKVRSC